MHRDSQKDPTDTLESLKANSNISIAHLNINSYRYKFTELKNIIKNYFDIFVIAETSSESTDIKNLIEETVLKTVLIMKEDYLSMLMRTSLQNLLISLIYQMILN